LIAEWNFNDLTAGSGNATTGTPPSNQGQTSYAPSNGAGSLDLEGWTVNTPVAGNPGTPGITNFGGTTTNAYGGAGAGQALALQGGATGVTGVQNNGAMLILGFDLSGFVAPILTFASQGTGTGFVNNQVSYSTDGVAYTSFSTYSPVANFADPNGLHTFDFSAIEALEFASSVFLKIAFLGASSVTGNNRIDNIQLNATAASPVPLPGSGLVFSIGLIAVGMARRRIKAALA
jgi:hypothetical protein